MPKETPVVVGTDPIEIIGHQRSVRKDRGEPRVVEMSTVDAVVQVQHAYDLGCNIPFNHGSSGIFPRTAHTLFRVAHGLTTTPNEVYPHRISNEIGYQGGDLVSKYGPDDAVPDTNFFSGYNPCNYRDTTTNGSVLIATHDPYADAKYSYFTVAFPVTVWPVVVTASETGEADVELPEYWGIALTATAQFWKAPAETLAPAIEIGNNVGLIDPRAAASCTMTTTNGIWQVGYPNLENRIIRVYVGIFDPPKKREVLVNVFCAPRNASKVRVRVISRVWENVNPPNIVISPSSEAQPVS